MLRSRGGAGVLCNILELDLVRFPSGIIKNGTSFSLHFLRGNGLRREWTCDTCFLPYLGLWETGMYLGFGSRHISHLTTLALA